MFSVTKVDLRPREVKDERSIVEESPGPEDVGARIRAYRQLRHATLRTVAQRAGITEGFLSQLERGLTSASLATLRRIALALDLEMADLFGAEAPSGPHVSTPAGRATLAFGRLGTKQLLTAKPYRHLEVFVGTFEPGGTTGPEPLVHGHSQELLYVLAGTIRLDLGEDSFELSQEESIDYDSGTPHRVTEIGGGIAKVMWIISPPSY